MRLFVLVLLGGLLLATPDAFAQPACVTTEACAQKCSPRNKAACDRLYDLLDPELEYVRSGGAPPAYTTARTSAGAACKAKHQRSCVLLGEFEELGVGGDQDPVSAKARFLKACKAGFAEGCITLGEAYLAYTIDGASKEAARDTFDDACDRGMADACGRLGDLALTDAAYVTDAGRDKEVSAAIKRLDGACEQKSAWSCGRLGDVYFYGYLPAPDATAGAKYHRKACKLGRAASCVALLGSGYSEATDRAMYETACADGSADVCATLASLETTAEGQRKYQDLACEAGSGYVCDQLGRRELACAYGVPTACELVEAERQCGTGDAVACSRVARDAIEHGTSADAAPVVTACEGGDAASCTWLASSGRADAAVATRGAAKGCELGDNTLCIAYGDRLAQGLGVTKDLATAIAVLERACTTDPYAWACTRLNEVRAMKQHDDQLAVCAAGDALTCYAIGEYSAACVAGSADGCAQLAGTQTDPALMREYLQRACDLGRNDACYTAGYYWQTAGDVTRAVDDYTRACYGAQAYACTAALALVDPSTDQYQTLRGLACQQGDTTMCTAAPPSVGGKPKRRSFDRRVELGYAAVQEGDLQRAGITARVEAHWSGSAERGLAALARGGLMLDDQMTFGFDGAIGVGVHRRIKKLHLEALALAGGDRHTVGEMAGAPSALYAGVEAAVRLQLGEWVVAGAYDFLARQGDPDEHRLFGSLETVGRYTYGFGLRATFYDRVATESAIVAYIGW